MPTPLLAPGERRPVPPAPVGALRYRALKVCHGLLTLWLGDLFLRLGGARTRTRRRRRMRRALRGLGVVWTRTAQMLMLRGSAFATPFGHSILALSDVGYARAFDEVAGQLDQALGRPWTEVFAHVEPRPFFAGTAAQIHKARLRHEDVDVAVKVQHPLAAGIFARDLRLLGVLIRLARLVRLWPTMRWAHLLHELREMEKRELNYRYEAAALARLGEAGASRGMHVPEVYEAYSCARVLVMQFISGALLSDVTALRKQDPARVTRWLSENNICLKTVGERLFDAVHHQVFSDNYFHGDLHPGNIILLRNSRFAVIECRSAGALERESLSKQHMLLHNIVRGEHTSAAEIYFLLATRLPRVDLGHVKTELLRIWRIWSGDAEVTSLSYQRRSLSTMLARTNALLNHNRFAAQWSFSVLTKTWTHLDICLAQLHPRMNYAEALRHYFQRDEARRVKEGMVTLPGRIGNSILALREIPRRMEEYTLFQESLMRRQAQVVQGSSSKLEGLVAAWFSFASLLVLLATCFAGLVWFAPADGVWLKAVLGPQLHALGGHLPHLSGTVRALVPGVLLAVFLFLRLQKHRFERRRASVARQVSW